MLFIQYISATAPSTRPNFPPTSSRLRFTCGLFSTPSLPCSPCDLPQDQSRRQWVAGISTFNHQLLVSPLYLAHLDPSSGNGSDQRRSPVSAVRERRR